MTFKPRAPRVRLSPLHRLQFLRNDKGRKIPGALANISKSGMGILRAAIDAEIGDEFEGELKILEQKFPLNAEVRHLTPGIVGCEFVGGATKEVAAAVSQYFKVEICGMHLHHIDKKYLRKDSVGDVDWYTDGGTNEIYVVRSPQGIVDFHISFLGNYIQGGAGKPTLAGHIVEPEDNVKMKGSSLIEMLPIDSSEILFHGGQLLEYTEDMPLEQREELLKLLRG